MEQSYNINVNFRTIKLPKKNSSTQKENRARFLKCDVKLRLGLDVGRLLDS